MVEVFYFVEDDLSRSVLDRIFIEYCGPAVSASRLEDKSGGKGTIMREEIFKKFCNLASRSQCLF